MLGGMAKNNRAVRAARIYEVHFFDAVCQRRREIFKFRVVATIRTHNSISFILYTYLNGASNSALSTTDVELTIVPFPKCLFSSNAFAGLAAVVS